MPGTFKDRRDAGRTLAAALKRFAAQPDVLVLGLPRGGVVVAAEVAEALQAPLEVLVVRKLGVPGHEELAMGAIASGGATVINDDVLRRARVDARALEAVAERERAELARRERLYRGERPPLAVGGRVALVVDDGLATGSTMLAAVRALRAMQWSGGEAQGEAQADEPGEPPEAGPARIVVAVPVGAPDTCEQLRSEADEVICATMPEDFLGVGRWYDQFEQTTDDEVQRLLRQASRRTPPASTDTDTRST